MWSIQLLGIILKTCTKKSTKSLLAATRSIVKRSDIYKTFGIRVGFLSLDVFTRWLSTITMLRNAYEARVVRNTVTSKDSDIRSFSISPDVWEESWSICEFLGAAASLTECQSGSCYATLSITIKTFQALLSKYRIYIVSYDSIFTPLAQKCKKGSQSTISYFVQKSRNSLKSSIQDLVVIY